MMFLVLLEGSAGILLIFSAIENKNPAEVLQGWFKDSSKSSGKGGGKRSNVPHPQQHSLQKLSNKGVPIVR
jgi:hypothetical protein